MTGSAELHGKEEFLTRLHVEFSKTILDCLDGPGVIARVFTAKGAGERQGVTPSEGGPRDVAPSPLTTGAHRPRKMGVLQTA